MVLNKALTTERMFRIIVTLSFHSHTPNILEVSRGAIKYLKDLYQLLIKVQSDSINSLVQ